MSVTTDTLETGIYTLLSTTAELTAQVGTRIFPDVAPQSDENGLPTSFPYVVYTVVSDIPTDHMLADSGISEARVQIDVYALDSVTRGAIYNIIQAYADGLQCTFVNPIQIDSVFLRENRRSKENAQNDSDCTIYRSMLEFSVWYRLPVFNGGAPGPWNPSYAPANSAIPRAYSYPTTATFPATPQLYTMFYGDIDGTVWICEGGSTTWVIVNTVG